MRDSKTHQVARTHNYGLVSSRGNCLLKSGNTVELGDWTRGRQYMYTTAAPSHAAEPVRIKVYLSPFPTPKATAVNKKTTESIPGQAQPVALAAELSLIKTCFISNSGIFILLHPGGILKGTT